MADPSGDQLSPAIEALLARFAGVVRRIGARFRVERHDLDELLQEVRVRLWHARATREQIEATPASYIYRVATSAALDLLRRRRARPALSLEGEVEEDREPADGATPADARVEAGELGELVSAAIEEITPSRRLVVRLHLSGYDRDEIASMLDWSEAKVRNLLYRGLAELRVRLAARGIGAGGTR